MMKVILFFLLLPLTASFTLPTHSFTPRRSSPLRSLVDKQFYDPSENLGERTAPPPSETCSSIPLVPGTAVLDTPWEDLGFEYRQTRSHLKMVWKDGAWSEPVLVTDPYVKVHVGATALHYGQACFEGLKAFAHADDTVHIFRPRDNAARLKRSCERVCMPFPSESQFVDAVTRVVQDNVDYVPPYGSNGALYVRPLLFGSGERIGLSPADEYTFIVIVMPVGDYYKGGIQPVPALIIDDYDRAAPRGVGGVKVAGNYAADMLPNIEGKKRGFPIGLYLDSATQTMVEEFSTSNFIGLKPDGSYVTPGSDSVLPSITNKSLMQIAEDEGMKVERRDIHVDELSEFDEVIACGTAVVVTAVGKIVRGTEVINYVDEGSEVVGAKTMRMYERVRRIQNGEEDDKWGWCHGIC